jgi:hypothetical protein
MQYGVAMYVNPLDENIFPRLKFNQDELGEIVDKITEGIEVADMILIS